MTVRLEIEGHVARVTINRPQVMNALDETSTAALEGIWQRIEADPDVRVVVLTGAGDRAFCTGEDMRADGGKTGLAYWASAHPSGFGALSLRTTSSI